MSLWSRLTHRILDHPYPLLVVVAALTVFLGYWATQVQTDHKAGNFADTDRLYRAPLLRPTDLLFGFRQPEQRETGVRITPQLVGGAKRRFRTLQVAALSPDQAETVPVVDPDFEGFRANVEKLGEITDLLEKPARHFASALLGFDGRVRSGRLDDAQDVVRPDLPRLQPLG